MHCFWPKLKINVVKRWERNKYEVLHFVLYAICAHKNIAMPSKSLKTAVDFCWRLWKSDNWEKGLWVSSLQPLFIKRLNLAFYLVGIFALK